MKYHSYL